MDGPVCKRCGAPMRFSPDNYSHSCPRCGSGVAGEDLMRGGGGGA